MLRPETFGMALVCIYNSVQSIIAWTKGTGNC